MSSRPELRSGGWELSSLVLKGDRAEQQDAIAIVPYDQSAERGGFLIALADGMGGHNGGALAARLAVSCAISAFSAGRGSARERLRKACDAADNAIKLEKQVATQDLQNMGSTLILCCLQPEAIHWLSVGDSLLLDVQRQRLKQLNAEHSRAVQLDDMVRRGEISPKEAESDPHRRALTSAIVGTGVNEIDEGTYEGAWPQDSALIIASDGMFALSEAELFQPLHDRMSAGSMADRYENFLMRKVGQGRDNISIIVCRHYD